MLSSVCMCSAAGAAAAAVFVTTLAFGQATAPSAGEELPTRPPVVASATRGERPVGAAPPVGFRGGVLDPPRQAPDFTLQAHDGAAFRLSEQRRHVVALVFGYTFCPDVCPTTLAELAQVRIRLDPAAAARLRVVFVTVDPERDDVARLRAYTQAFDHTFVGLTGTLRQLVAVQKSYGVIVKKHVAKGTAAAYFVDHSAFVYVIDGDGRLRLMLPFGTSIDTMTHDIGLLLGR